MNKVIDSKSGSTWTVEDMLKIMQMLGTDQSRYNITSIKIVTTAGLLNRSSLATYTRFALLCYWYDSLATSYQPVLIKEAVKRFKEEKKESTKKKKQHQHYILISWFCKKSLKNTFVKACVPSNYGKEAIEKLSEAFLDKQNLTCENSDNVEVWLSNKAHLREVAHLVTKTSVKF